MNLKYSAWILALFCAMSLTRLAADTTRPNILLVLSDDHSVPHLGVYGSPNAITPNLDAFAAESMRFTRAYTTSPQCAPSRTSIFYGQTPVALGSARFAQPARPENTAVTDVLRAHGYWAGLDGRAHHLCGNKEMETPFLREAFEEYGFTYHDDRFDHIDVFWTRTEDAIAAIPQELNETLDKVPEGTPFFLYFGFIQPHRDWKAYYPEKFVAEELVLPPDFPDLPEVRVDYARYLSSVYNLDRGFGLLMRALEQRGVADNTIVIFMGDNGESLLRGKGTLYERGLNVPLLVRWPGVVASNSESDILIGGEDLAPTLLDALDLPIPEKMSGVSFLPALKGKPFDGREYVYGERGWHYGPPAHSNGLDLSRSVVDRRYRLIYNLLPERPYIPVDMPGRTPAWPAILAARDSGQLSALHEQLLFPEQRPVYELYDLENDRYQLHNLSGQSATEEVETRLRQKLAQWMIRDSDFLPLPLLDYPN